MRYSSLSSKSLGLPPCQMRKVLLFTTVCGVISPTIELFSTRQYTGLPSHPFNVLPSNIDSKPDSSPARGKGRSLCFGAYGRLGFSTEVGPTFFSAAVSDITATKGVRKATRNSFMNNAGDLIVFESAGSSQGAIAWVKPT